MKRNEKIVQNENEPSEALKEKSDSIRKMMCNADTRDARLRYDIGLQVHDAMTDGDKYGKGAVEYIAAELGCTAVNLYDHACVAKCWTSSEFDELIKRRTPSRMPLAFAHFVVLAKVRKPEDRQRLLTECLGARSSVRELKKRVAEVAPRKHADPAAHGARPFDAVRRLVASSNSWVIKAQADIETLGKVDGADAGKMVEQIELARDGYAKARTLIEQLESRMTELINAAKSKEHAA
jgi:hypothetical protein